MSDFVGYIIQGFAISIGTFVGSWFSTKHIEGKLKHLENVIDKVKSVSNGVEVNK